MTHWTPKTVLGGVYPQALVTTRHEVISEHTDANFLVRGVRQFFYDMRSSQGAEYNHAAGGALNYGEYH